MKKLLIISMLLFSSLVSAKVSWEETKQIYTKLVKSNGLHIAPRLALVDHINGNRKQAATGIPWQNIYITRDLIKHLNRDEVAFTLGHELGHYTSWHIYTSPPNEFKADQKGLRYTNRAGYNGCNGIQWLKGTKGSNTHPSGSERIKRAGC